MPTLLLRLTFYGLLLLLLLAYVYLSISFKVLFTQHFMIINTKMPYLELSNDVFIWQNNV